MVRPRLLPRAGPGLPAGDLAARVGRGTLAALVGPGGLPADRMSRRLGFARVAKAQRELIDADIRAAAEAYVSGINQASRLG